MTLDCPQQIKSEKIVLDDDGQQVALKQLHRVERPKPKRRALSQASEELKAKEVETEECLRVTGIDDIEIYSVEEGSEGSVEVSLVYQVGSRQFLFLLSNGVRCSSDK